MKAKECVTGLVSLRLEPLENLLETVQAWLAHSIQRIGPLHLAKVGRSVAPGGVENVSLAVHVLDHEVLPLESEVQREAFTKTGIKKGISEVVKCFTGKSVQLGHWHFEVMCLKSSQNYPFCTMQMSLNFFCSLMKC